MAKSLKPFWFISVFIMQDRYGEWWESLKTDGSTRMWQGMDYKPTMEFKTEEKARKFCETFQCSSGRWKLLRSDPPVSPSKTWEQTIVIDHQPK